MNTKWLALAAAMLEEAADDLSNNGCNDWSFPKGWTKADKREFAA